MVVHSLVAGPVEQRRRVGTEHTRGEPTLIAPSRIGFLAKDPWHPAFRREQMIAGELVRRGSAVRFVQAPADVRRVRTDPANWWAHLRRARFQTVVPGISVTERSTLQPGLRSGAAERIDAGLLAAFLRRSNWDADLSVFMLPWEWRAARSIGGSRVFDCTDDWARLLPHARGLPDQLRRIADEADQVVVVNQALADLFPGRIPVVVPNGTDETLLSAPRTAQPRERHAVYVGSISERFEALATEFPGRFRYAGLLSRERLADVLDGATVGLLPDVASIALGQSSMKTYDYCARGLPVVATAGHLEHSSDAPPHTAVVRGAREMAEAMVAAVDEPVSHAKERIGWAAERTWARRTDAWLAAVTGDVPAPGIGVQSTQV